MHDKKKDMDCDGVRHRKQKANNKEKSKSEVNAEYFQALEQWLNDARSYRYSCSFFPGFPYTTAVQNSSQFTPFQLPSFSNVTNTPFNQDPGVFVLPNYQQQQHQQQTFTEEAVEYKIPPIWKRFMAEAVDFILLFIMKLAITFIAIDFFDFIDLEKYESLQQPEKLDIKVVLEVTSEITFLEIVYKLLVCLYEGIFLRKGIQNQVGGATPGKTFMGIRVILCNSIEPVDNQGNIVRVTPAKDLGFGWSFARALLKNLVLALLLPICFPFFFNKFNRTAYDILCHSVVVEDRVPPNRNR